MKSNEQLKKGLAQRHLSEKSSAYPSRITPNIFNKINTDVMDHDTARTVSESGRSSDYRNGESVGKLSALPTFAPNNLEELAKDSATTSTDKSAADRTTRVTPNIFSHSKKSPRPRAYQPSGFGPYAPYRHLNKQTIVTTGTGMLNVGTAIVNCPSAVPTVEEVSAGGIVIDTSQGGLHVAVIARYNRAGRIEWCLPKGHPEGEETLPEAAAREVEEETGIAGNIITALGNVDYWFNVDGYRVHKTVHHFLLEKTGGELTVDNDPDQETVDVAWIRLDNLGRHLTFLNEKRIAEIAIHILELQ